MGPAWAAGGLRIGAQIVDAQPFADREVAEPSRRLPVDARVHEGHKAAVGGADAQGGVAGAGQFHRRFEDAVQRHVQVQIGAELDDDPHQLFHLVARRDQLIELVVHLAHQFAPALPGEGGVIPVAVHRHQGSAWCCRRAGAAAFTES